MIINTIIDKLKKRNTIKYWRDKGATIGENCQIYSTCSFDSEPYLVTIGNHVRINNGVRLITHDGAVWVVRGGQNQQNKDVDLFGKITIGNNVSIGTNAAILPNVTIGDNVIIGYGAVVTHDIPSNSVAAGVPARVIKTVDEYYNNNKDKFVNTKCFSYEEKKKFLKDKGIY